MCEMGKFCNANKKSGTNKIAREIDDRNKETKKECGKVRGGEKEMKT